MVDLLELFPDDIAAEIEDERYLSSTHGRASTYNTGCRGPLCRMANREKTTPDAKRLYKARERDDELKIYLAVYLVSKGISSAA